MEKAPPGIQVLLDIIDLHGAAALGEDDFRKVAAWDPGICLIADAGRMNDREFDLGVCEYPDDAVSYAAWRLNPAQLRYCIRMASSTALELIPAAIPEDMTMELCRINPGYLLRLQAAGFLPNIQGDKLTQEHIKECAVWDPGSVVNYAADRVTDEQLMEFLDSGDQYAESCILVTSPERVPHVRLLALARAHPINFNYETPLLSKEELVSLLDDTLGTAIWVCPEILTPEQLDKAILLHPGIALERLPEEFMTPEQISWCVEQDPGKAISKFYPLMREPQVRRALKEARHVPYGVVEQLSDELFDEGLRLSGSPLLGTRSGWGRLTPEQLMFLAENFPVELLEDGELEPTDLLTADCVNEAFQVAAEKAPGSAIEDCYNLLTLDQIRRYAHADIPKGLRWAPEAFTDEEYIALAEIYPEAAAADTKRHYRLIDKFKLTTRGREASPGLLSKVSWDAWGGDRCEQDEVRARSLETGSTELDLLSGSADENVVLAVASNPNTSSAALSNLTYHPFGVIQDAALENPNMPLGTVVSCARESHTSKEGYRIRDGAWDAPKEALAERFPGLSGEDLFFLLTALIELPEEDLVSKAPALAAATLETVKSLSLGQKVALANILHRHETQVGFVVAVSVAKETTSSKFSNPKPLSM